MWNNRNQFEDLGTEIEEGKSYTKGELGAITDNILKEDSRAELCRECGGRGTETGKTEPRVQEEALDENGKPITLLFPEFVCDNDHRWFEGEGKARGIGGENPILFEEHIYSRRRREILCAAGTPDPSIVSGIYLRTHPEGRKVNSKEARTKHGASYYR